MSAPPVPTYFLGVTPSAALAGRVLAWQRSHGHVVTAPHVTVRGPGLRPEAFAACEAACREAVPFSLRLGADAGEGGGVGTFGRRVIYLRVGESPELHALHRALVAAAGDPAGPHDLGGYHPHLTLALSWRRLDRPWEEVLASAREVFGAEGETAQVEAVTLYRKARSGEPYFPQAEWRFSIQIN